MRFLFWYKQRPCEYKCVPMWCIVYYNHENIVYELQKWVTHMFFKRKRERSIDSEREGEWDERLERSTQPGIMSLSGSHCDSLLGDLMRRNVSTLNFNPITRVPTMKVIYMRFTIIVIRNFMCLAILTWIFSSYTYYIKAHSCADGSL